MTEITDRDHVTARDIERRIEETHKRWLIDSLQLCHMAELSLELSMEIMNLELVRRAVNSLSISDLSPDEAGKVIADAIRIVRREKRAKPTRQEGPQAAQK